MKETSVNFFLNVLSVILGIAITFSIQGLIDRSKDKEDTRSALELVRSELSNNIKDIGIMSDYLVQERKSARYFLKNIDRIDKCPMDSINYHGGIIFADASITLSHDALELLKMSSMFQKIGNNDLSMKIIRAYDTCSSIISYLNRHLEDRNSQMIEQSGVSAFKDYLKSKSGVHTVRWLANRADPTLFTDVTDIQDAIDAIDAYMK